VNITEQPLAEKVASNLSGAAAEGAALAGVAVDAPPQKIVESLNAYVADSLNNSSNEVDNWTDRALPLGCLWAAQLIREFGWEWATVVQHDENDFKMNVTQYENVGGNFAYSTLVNTRHYVLHRVAAAQ
jgi:hypothetical protein